jgi:hypothetical protein
VEGADPEAIARTIESFPDARRADLWGGVGLASAYAGGVEREGLVRLKAEAGDHWPELAQGAAFAAKARERAGNPAPHTEMACGVYGSVSAETAATIAEEAEADSLGRGADRYEAWRQRIRDRFRAEPALT